MKSSLIQTRPTNCIKIDKKVIDKIKSKKKINDFLINIGEKLSTLGSVGGKGSQTWRSIGKELKSKKSKLLR